MRFIHPEFAYLFILIAIMVFKQFRQNQSALVHPAIAPHLAEALTDKRQNRKKIWLIIYFAIVLSVLVFSLMQPTLRLSSGKDLRPLFIVLDQSPTLTDQTTNRAKRLLTKVLQFGIERPKMIIVFSGSAHSLFPLTNQDKVNQLYLQYLNPKIMPVKGNDLSNVVPIVQKNKQAMSLGFDLLLLTGSSISNPSPLINLTNTNKGHILFWPLTKEAEGVLMDPKINEASYQQILDEKNTLFQTVSSLSDGKKESEVKPTSMGYPLVVLAAILLLPWFIRGFHLSVSKGNYKIMVLSLFFSLNASADLIDWFYSKDQQGQKLMAQNKYSEAANTFENRQWKATAFYYAKNYKEAKKIWQDLGDLESLFNLATVYAADRKYSISITIYQLLLKIKPNHKAAQENLEIIIKTLREVNSTSAAQQEEEGDENNTVSLDEEDPLSELFNDEGKERKAIGERTQTNKNLKAEKFLENPKMIDKWLRNISKDPSQYLRARFFIEDHHRKKESINE